jgi:hypothetical protein
MVTNILQLDQTFIYIHYKDLETRSVVANKTVFGYPNMSKVKLFTISDRNHQAGLFGIESLFEDTLSMKLKKSSA